jgi:hypothetical protein
MLGAKNTKIDKPNINKKIVIKSLNIKYGAKGSLSKLPDTPNGLPEPALSCNAIKCIKANAANTNGNTKCSAKNLFKVALLTLNPPHRNSTISCPIHGIALIRFVITVAPHNDI